MTISTLAITPLISLVAGVLILVMPRLLNYIVAIYLILGLSAYTLVQDYITHNWTNGIFAFVNTTLTAYALLMFVGVGNSLVDIGVGLWNWLHVPVRSTAPAAAEPGAVDWQSVLYFGPGESTASQAAERHIGRALPTRGAVEAPAPADDAVTEAAASTAGADGTSATVEPVPAARQELANERALGA